jgi:hypothetical protein
MYSSVRPAIALLIQPVLPGANPRVELRDPKKLREVGWFCQEASEVRKAFSKATGGETGLSGQCLKATWVFRHSTKCSGALGRPHEQTSLASRCLNFVWYQLKSPCDVGMARRR